MVGKGKRVAAGSMRSHHATGRSYSGSGESPTAVFSSESQPSQAPKNEQTGFPRIIYAALAGSLIVGGCLMAVGRVLPEHFWLTWVALVPLFVLIRLVRPVGAFLSGLLWGASFFSFSKIVAQSDVAGTWGSFVLLSVVPAFYAFVAALVTRRVGFSPFVLAFGWTGVELALMPLGLRNGLLATPLAGGLLIRPLAHLFGFVLVAFLVAFVNAMLVGLLGRIRRAIPGRDFVASSPPPATLFVSLVRTHAADHPRCCLMPRAPPISPFDWTAATFWLPKTG